MFYIHYLVYLNRHISNISTLYALTDLNCQCPLLGYTYNTT